MRYSWLRPKGALICRTDIARQGVSPCTPANHDRCKMAIYHLTAKTISRGKGQSAVASAAYRSEKKLHDQRLGKTFDYTRKGICKHSEIMSPEIAPQWVFDREKLWNQVEFSEKRKDSQLSREIELALPIELNRSEQIALVREFVQANYVSVGMVADFNLHEKEGNPHAHIMLTTRNIDEKGFGLKNTDWNKKNLLMEWRKDWADKANYHLARAGHDIRIDHRSHAERGIDLEPQSKIGSMFHRRRNVALKRYEEHQRIARENGQRIINDPNIGLDYITSQQAVFGEIDLYKLAHTQSEDREQYKQVCSALFDSPELVRLGNDDNGRTRYTTLSVLEAEHRLMDNAVSMSRRLGHTVDDRFLDQARATRTLTKDQDRAFEYICKSGDMACVVGYAGSGKSYTLGAVREAFEAQGYTCKGAALAGIAAEGLQAESGIDSKTIAKRLWEIENRRDQFTNRDILIIDEAGMVGTRQMDRLIQYAIEQGAKVVLVGDHQQLQPIEMGGPFRGIFERTGVVKLTEIRRQEKDWQKTCTQQLEGPDAGKALDTYNENGCIHQHDTQEQAANAVVSQWKDFVTENNSAKALMLAYRNVDVQSLNQQGRAVAKELGLLSGKEREIKTSKGVLNFCKGDRIVFLRGNYQMDVRNGTLGTIERIRRDIIQVRVDNGDRLVFDAKEYNTFNHGYASTVHKSQGATVQQSFVLADPLFNRHSALTALTRHKDDVQLHWSKEQFGNFDALKAALTREQYKELAIDFSVVRGIEPQLSNQPLKTKNHQIMKEQDGQRNYHSNGELAHGTDRAIGRGSSQEDSAHGRPYDHLNRAYQAVPGTDTGRIQTPVQRNERANAIDGPRLGAEKESRNRGMGERHPVHEATVSRNHASNQGLSKNEVDKAIDSGADSFRSFTDHLRVMAESLLEKGQGDSRTVSKLEPVHGQVHATEQKTTTDRQRNIGDQMGMKNDRTTEAVQLQLRAMGCERFEVGIRDAKKNLMMNRTWSKEEVLKSVPWLKRMNAIGNDIYIRPAQDTKHNLVLVDDIDGVTVEQMMENGHSPALVVETSPKNLQAWLKVVDHEKMTLPEGHRATIARVLTQSYEADPGSADARHYGRLAGFTNQKSEHQDKYGRQPYCLLRHSSGRLASKGRDLVRQAETILENQAQQVSKTSRINAIIQNPKGYGVVNEYKFRMSKLVERYGKDIDWSRADWMVCKDLVQKGYKAEDIKRAIYEASPGLMDRKKDHFEYYINRTVERVCNDPGVQKNIEGQKQRDRSRGPGLSM